MGVVERPGGTVYDRWQDSVWKTLGGCYLGKARGKEGELGVVILGCGCARCKEYGI